MVHSRSSLPSALYTYLTLTLLTGGPLRHQKSSTIDEFKIRKGEILSSTSRDFLPVMCTMCILGDPGEVFLLTHTYQFFGPTTTSQVLCLDPITLQTRYSSAKLPGGPFWPGGFAIHADGSIIVVYGRYVHKLSRQTCDLLSTFELPVHEPYNRSLTDYSLALNLIFCCSFVILDNGYIVTKNKSDSSPAVITILTPNLERVCPDLVHFEPCVARLSSVGTTFYLIGVTTVCRYIWSESSHSFSRDANWMLDYVSSTGQEYGWDGVIDIPNNNFWFIDNGKHNYVVSMVGAGLHPTPNRLIRVSLSDSRDQESIIISGNPHGCVTNPPLIDPERRIVVAFDSSNRYLSAYRYQQSQHYELDSPAQTTTLSPLWSKPNFGVAGHMIFFSKSGYFFVNNYSYWSESVALMDIQTGNEIATVRTGGIYQGVVFPSVGWDNDVYWVTIGQVSRIFISEKKEGEESSGDDPLPLVKRSIPITYIAFATFLGYSW
jgi:hypothetical protein